MSIRVGFPKVLGIKTSKQRIYTLKAYLKEESWAIDTTRTWKSYGTWSISVWVNTSHFEEELAEELRENIIDRIVEWAD